MKVIPIGTEVESEFGVGPVIFASEEWVVHKTREGEVAVPPSEVYIRQEGIPTKRVRIAVAINSNGDWNSCGWSNVEEFELRDIALDGLDFADDLPEHIVFVEAEVPLPSFQTVVGTTE